ncbi:MAG: hypothetical protein HY074_17525 [Deltaproteobacteria bacterium]|nr:hypothetical protein [Deltaproteobacteria bacterium]
MHFVRRAFEFPEPLSKALLAHFFKGENPNINARRSLAHTLRELWPSLALGRGQVEKDSTGAPIRHYSHSRACAEAYGAYYLPANAMKLPLILEEAFSFGLPLADAGAGPLRWLDVGCGPGTAFWGLAWWAAHRDLKIEYTGLEQSTQFIALAEALVPALRGQLPAAALGARWEIFQHGKTGNVLTEKIRLSKPHVVSFMNSIGEMAPAPGQRSQWLGEIIEALARVAQAGDSDGRSRWLVLVEPGSKAASRELLEMRESLRARDDVRVWLPCLSARPCGALAKPDDWCHEAAEIQFPDWLVALGADAELRKEAVLFSYLIVSVGAPPMTPAGWPGDGSRVVSQMMKEKGLTHCLLCTGKGKQKARVLNSRQTPDNGRFSEAVRGQVFSQLQLSEKGDVTGFADYDAATGLDATVFPPLRSNRRS